MFNFDKDLFITKVKNHGIEITEYAENAFMFPKLFAEVPELTVSCAYDGNNNTINIGASISIATNVENQTINALCNRLNSIAKFYTEIQGNFMVSGMKLDFSTIDYSDDNDALEYAAVFVMLFKQEFEPYGVKAFQYANSGNINYLT